MSSPSDDQDQRRLPRRPGPRPAPLGRRQALADGERPGRRRRIRTPGGRSRADQLPDPFVGRRSGSAAVALELLDQLGPQGVDQRLLAGVGQPLGRLSGPAHRRRRTRSGRSARRASGRRHPGMASTATLLALQPPAPNRVPARRRRATSSAAGSGSLVSPRPGSRSGRRRRAAAARHRERCRRRARGRRPGRPTRCRRTSDHANQPRSFQVGGARSGRRRAHSCPTGVVASAAASATSPTRTPGTGAGVATGRSREAAPRTRRPAACPSASRVR